MLHVEQRKSYRFDLEYPIVYAYHNSDKFFNATITNCSALGMCLQSNYPVKEGAQIYIMTDNNPIDDLRGEVYDSSLGIVLWCKKYSGFYKIGVRYSNKSINSK